MRSISVILPWFTLLKRYQRKMIRNTTTYGVKKRNMIPLLRLSASVVSPWLTLFFTWVRHIAHCAQFSNGSKTKYASNTNLFMSSKIIRTYHEINDNTGYWYVQPNRESISHHFFMPFNLIGKSIVKGKQDKGHN